MRALVRIAQIVLLAAVCSGAFAAEYKLGPGDWIAVKIINFDNLNSEVKVQPDGDITIPLVGAVTASGKTAPALSKDLETKYSEYLVKPSVSVTIQQFRQDTCIVLGQVVRPGPTPIVDDTTVLGAIAAAGGTLDKADLSKVTLMRSASTRLLDLLAAISDSSGDTGVKPGDVIVVPEATVGLLVLGSVAKPGNCDWKEGMRVMDAVNAAGGLLEEANPGEAVLTGHGGKQTMVNLHDLIAKGVVEHNLVLQRGDVLYVPRQERLYYVFGEVVKTGQYPMKGGDRLLEALSAAGGTTANADLSGIGIVRLVNGKPEVVRADLSRLVKKADQSQNTEIVASDVIFVPEKKRKWSWADLTAPISILGLAIGLGR